MSRLVEILSNISLMNYTALGWRKVHEAEAYNNSFQLTRLATGFCNGLMASVKFSGHAERCARFPSGN